jgi:glycosyltransferase involved in cell wall biosynthesis
MFSIVIPLYNKEDSVAMSLRSILAQSFQEFEVIIVNDGSTDRSIEQIKGIADDRIHLIEQANQGVSVARNTGIENANCDFIAFLDADDLWHRDYLQCMADCINRYPGFSWWGADYISTVGDSAIRANNEKQYVFCEESTEVVDFFERSRIRYIVHMTSFVARRDALLSKAKFPVGFKYYEDLEVFCRLAQLSPLPMVGHVLSYWRQDAENRACNRRKVMALPPIFTETIAMVEEGGVKCDEARSQCLFIIELLLNEAALMCASGQNRAMARRYARMGMTYSESHIRGAKAYLYSWLPAFMLRGLFFCTRRIRRVQRACRQQS